MGQDEREPPFFFTRRKTADAVVRDGATVPYPPLTKDLHHEVELVVALKGHGRNVKAAQALDLIGYAVGIEPHPARPADRRARDQAPVGDRQGVRRLRAVRSARRLPRSAIPRRAESR